MNLKGSGLRRCKSHFTRICMADIESLGGNAALLWVILCNKWDLAARNKKTADPCSRWVVVTRKTVEIYGLKKDAYTGALKKLESLNMVIVERHPRKSARVKMRKIHISTVGKSADGSR